MISITADRSDKKKRKIKNMGRGVLAAGMAGSEPGLGAGDTFGISCVCSQTPSGTGSDGGFLVFHCLFHYQDHGRISSGSSFGNPVGSSGGGVSPVRQLLEPAVLTIKSIPVASFVILVLIWVPSENLSVVISFLWYFL